MDEAHPPIPQALPWQTAAWQQITRSLAADRMPHAILLAGGVGIGKNILARAIAARLLCEQPENELACGQCRGCQLVRAGSHPDCIMISPEEGGSGIIKIEPIRALTQFSQRTSQYNGYRVAILSPAEAMNRNTANALLKTLEEPPAGIVIILVSHHPGRLSATVRSRCQQYRLGIPNRSQALTWLAERGVTQADALLALSGGAPLAALEWAQSDGLKTFQALTSDIKALLDGRASAVAVAQQWQGSGALTTSELMQRLVLALSRWQVDGAQNALLGTDGQAIAQSMNAARLQQIDERLKPLHAASRQPLARELSVEALFLLWSRP